MTLNPQRILIVLLGSIGDVTRAIPLANLLRHRYPKARITWALEPPAFPLVEHHPAVDEVVVFDRRRWWRSLGPFLRQIREPHFDLVFDLQRHLKSGFISWWSGAPIRLGFHRRNAKELNWLFNNHFISATDNGISKLSHYLKFAETLGIEPHPIEWGFSLLAEEQARVERMLQEVGSEFAVFFIGSRWESKEWFPIQSAKSALEIQQRYGLGIVLLGAKEDEPLAAEVESYPTLRVTNWVGRTSLREAIGILSKAKIAIGPDTGLMHLSAAVGTPVVSLWGATSPIRTGPYGYQHLTIQGKAACSPCYVRRCPIGRLCMKSIEVKEITAKVGEVLSQEGQTRGNRV